MGCGALLRVPRTEKAKPMSGASQLGAYILPGGVSDPCAGLVQAQSSEALGLGTVWLGERIDTKDFPSLLGALSQITTRVQLGVGVTPMNLRHPMVLASTGQTLQALSHGRFRMGFGKSAAWRWEGYGYPKPTIAGMLDFATILRGLWAGETVSYNGPAGRFSNIRLPQRVTEPPPPLYLAAIGPKTLAMAGAFYDGVILHPFLTPQGVRKSVKIVRDAARAARRAPEVVNIVATVVVAPDLSEKESALAINARAAGYFQIGGLGDLLVQANDWDPAALTNYRNDPRLTALCGKPADKFLSRDELIALTSVFPGDWIPSSSASGSSARCAAILRDYLSAGADEILVHGSTAEHLAGVVGAFGS